MGDGTRATSKAFRLPLLQIQNLAWTWAVRNLPRLLWEDDGQDEADAERVLGVPTAT